MFLCCALPLLNPEPADSCGLAIYLAPQSPFLLPEHSDYRRGTSAIWHLLGFWGSELWSAGRQDKCFMCWAISEALILRALVHMNSPSQFSPEASRENPLWHSQLKLPGVFWQMPFAPQSEGWDPHSLLSSKATGWRERVKLPDMHYVNQISLCEISWRIQAQISIV